MADRMGMLELDGFDVVAAAAADKVAVADAFLASAVHMRTPTVTILPPERETIEKHDKELNGSVIELGSDGLTARASGMVRSTHSLAAAADLAWSPVLSPLVTAGGVEVPKEVGQAVIRSDTGRPIGTVGARYTPVDHSHLFDLADAIANAAGGGLKFANAGHKGDGARPFVQMKMDGGVGGMDTEQLISLFTSHDGTLCLSAGFTHTVIVCRNTYAHALGEAQNGLRIKHTASAPALLAAAANIAELANKHHLVWSNGILRMIEERFEDADMANLAKVLLPGDATRTVNNRSRLTEAWHTAPGARPGTLFGAAQAVTYYTSHYAGSEESRAESAIFGTGIGPDMQATAWQYLGGGADKARTAIANKLHALA
jgi:phage/plasmid-like protein (TIGR03299 family)